MNSNDAHAPLLIVDDDPDDVFFLRRTLAATGCKNRAVVFSDGEEVLGYLKGICAMARGGSLVMPCLMFCDIRMPRVDGFSVLEWVRAEPLLGLMPVVMLSSSDLADDMQRANLLGALAYLVKHPDRQTLAEILRNVAASSLTGVVLD